MGVSGRSLVHRFEPALSDLAVRHHGCRYGIEDCEFVYSRCSDLDKGILARCSWCVQSLPDTGTVPVRRQRASRRRQSVPAVRYGTVPIP